MRSTIRGSWLKRAAILPTMFIIFGMLFLNFLALGFFKYRAQENIRINISDQIEIVKAAIYQPFWSIDNESMDMIVESILSQQAGSIAAIRVIEISSEEGDEKILVDRIGTKWSSHNFEDFKKDNNFVYLASPVVYQGTKLGSVEIIFSTDEMQKDISKIAFLFGAVTLFFSALCGSLFLVFFYRRHSAILQKQVAERSRELDARRMTMVNSARLVSLGEMSAGIAHEINNPLLVIEGIVGLLSKTIKTYPDSEKLIKNLDKISSMVTRISKIINGLRAFSRDGSHEEIVDFNINNFFSNISDLCQAYLLHKNIELKFKIEDPNLFITGREVPLSQVIINIINNSTDAVEKLTDKWILVESYEALDEIVIAITDSGKGIPEDVQKKMMQPFFTTKEIGKGTGLGLSISVGIVESHGGRLIYRPEYKNTRFEVRLKKSQKMQLPEAA